MGGRIVAGDDLQRRRGEGGEELELELEQLLCGGLWAKREGFGGVGSGVVLALGPGRLL